MGHGVDISEVKCHRGNRGHICQVGDPDHLIHSGQTGHMGRACLAGNFGN